LLDASDGEHTWGSIGVSENIIEASWQALVDAIEYGMLHGAGEAPADDGLAAGAPAAGASTTEAPAGDASMVDAPPGPARS
jgi:hypothetical protein